MRYLTVMTAALSVLLMLVQPAEAEKAAPAAILLSCTGQVTVERDSGGEEPGAFGLGLYSGDVVRTGAASGAEIHFENGMWLQVGASSSMKIKSGTAKTQPSGVEVGDGSFKVVQNMMKLKDPKGASSLAALRSAPGKPGITLISPCQTKILTASPEFIWDSGGMSEELLLTIYDDKGVNREVKVDGGTSWQYPEAEPGLQPGISYSWTVETTDPLRVPPLRSTAAFFEIVSDEEASSLDLSLSRIDPYEISNKSTYHFLRASVYFEHGLLEDAISEMELAMKEGADSKEMHSILARLYAEAGRSTEALAEYDRIFEK